MFGFLTCGLNCNLVGLSSLNLSILLESDNTALTDTEVLSILAGELKGYTLLALRSKQLVFKIKTSFLLTILAYLVSLLLNFLLV